jgi:hypothetical protein
MGGNRNLLLSLPRLVLAFGLIGVNAPHNPVVNIVRAGAVVFLVVNMTKTGADLVIFLLRRSGLLPLVAYLLRAFRNGSLLLIELSPTSLLSLLLCLLSRLTALLLARPLLLAALLLSSPTLFVSPTLGFRILLCLVWVLIGHYGPPMVRKTGRHDCRPY